MDFTSYYATLMVSLAAGALLFVYKRRCRSKVKLTSRQAILITGCDSGIGLAVAEHFFTTTDATLVCTYLPQARRQAQANDSATVDNKPAAADTDTDTELLQSAGYKHLMALAAASNQHSRMHLVPLDLTCDESIEALAAFVEHSKSRSLFDDLWALVNNAGVLFLAEFDWHTSRQVSLEMNINVVGPMKLTNLLLHHIVASRGRVVNVSSVGDSTLFPGFSVYSATKAALTRFSLILRMELEKLNATCVIVRPGVVSAHTSILANADSVRQSMWASMSDTKRRLYAKSFRRFMLPARVHQKQAALVSPSSLASSPLFRAMDVAVLARRPPVSLVVATRAQRALFALLKFVPQSVEMFCAQLVCSVLLGNSRKLIDAECLAELQSTSSTLPPPPPPNSTLKQRQQQV